MSETLTCMSLFLLRMETPIIIYYDEKSKLVFLKQCCVTVICVTTVDTDDTESFLLKNI